MTEEIKESYDELIKQQIEDLADLETGSKEKSAAVEDLATLYRAAIEATKVEWDVDDKYNRRLMEEKQLEVENAQKADQLAEQVKDRYVKAAIAAGEVVLPLIFYGVWMRKGFKFEETGAFTSATFKGLINRFRPTKR